MQKSTLVIVILGLMLFALAPAALAQDTSPLEGTQWRLASFDGEPLVERTGITLAFTEGNQAGGNGGCNTYGSAYRVDESNISFEGVISTMMACAEPIMQQEQTYFAALQSATTYELRGDQLVISTGEGELVFDEAPSLIGTTWTLESLAGQPVEGELTLGFGEDGRVFGNGGCNGFGGPYTVNVDVLRIGPVISTMMACAEDALTAQEAAYFTALGSVLSYSLTDDQLVITYGDGQQMVFSPAASLANTQWQLSSLGGAEAAAGTNVTLEFRDDGRAGGNSGCNSFNTNYTLSNGALTFSEILSTRRACVDEAAGAQETALFAALESATGYRLEGDQLIITYGDGQELVLTQVTSLAGTSWELQQLGGADLVEGSSITLVFDTEGNAAGSGGCNQYTGNYTADSTTITFGMVASTERACLDTTIMQQEQTYYRALASATGYTLTADQLTITYADGQQLVYTRAAG